MSEDFSEGPLWTPGAPRGEETKQRLLEAALDLFGRRGFDGVGTRGLAEAAGVNVAGISYHFGSKEGLYRAVMENLVETITTRIAEPIAQAGRVIEDPDASPEMLREALLQLIDRVATSMIPDGPADSWARFIVREQMDPSSNFEIIFRRLLGPTHTALAKLISRVKNLPPDSEEAKLRVFMLLGQVVVFRAARATVMRGMGWETLSDAEFASVKPLLMRQIAAALQPEDPS